MPHRKRILLSDDNEGFSTLLLESLHEHGGFHVFHAREEHEVMETIQCHKPHILLLDDMLPHKGGLHVLRQLRERGKLDTLPEKLRLPLWLFYLEGFSIAELAQTLGVPEGTVKYRLHQARKALKVELTEESEVRHA